MLDVKANCLPSTWFFWAVAVRLADLSGTLSNQQQYSSGCQDPLGCLPIVASACPSQSATSLPSNSCAKQTLVGAQASYKVCSEVCKLALLQAWGGLSFLSAFLPLIALASRAC